jgi:hypothetical protein
MEYGVSPLRPMGSSPKDDHPERTRGRQNGRIWGRRGREPGGKNEYETNGKNGAAERREQYLFSRNKWAEGMIFLHIKNLF